MRTIDQREKDALYAFEALRMIAFLHGTVDPRKVGSATSKLKGKLKEDITKLRSSDLKHWIK